MLGQFHFLYTDDFHGIFVIYSDQGCLGFSYLFFYTVVFAF